MGRLFGTDGIRGKANIYPMTAETALNIGKAVAYHFNAHGPSPAEKSKIVIGRDPRLSGDMLEAALVAGICSMGVDTCLIGVMPTPAISYMTRHMRACAGIVISASHNPFYDNGIKIFNHNGFKLDDEVENRLEDLLRNADFISMCEAIRDTGLRYCIKDSAASYAFFLKQALDPNAGDKSGEYREKPFGDMNIILDGSNGATCQVAPRLFRELGAKVEAISVHPDGKNINDHCGSQHPEVLARHVVENKADAGLAFDGDGDRLIAVDETGKVISGDQILVICAHFAKQQNRLKNNTVVSTVMSNMGLHKALEDLDIEHVSSNVGDRYVLEKMLESGAVIGGEDSGHMIFLDHHTTGDGILTAVKLLEVMHTTGQKLSELAGIMTVYPQILLNVEVREKPDIATIPAIQAAISSVETTLGEKGRVLVRYSGTQPLCRVMVEGPDVDQTEKSCQRIATAIKNTIGI